MKPPGPSAALDNQKDNVTIIAPRYAYRAGVRLKACNQCVRVKKRRRYPTIVRGFTTRNFEAEGGRWSSLTAGKMSYRVGCFARGDGWTSSQPMN